MKSEFRLGHGLQTWFFRALGYLGTCSVGDNRRVLHDRRPSGSGNSDVLHGRIGEYLRVRVCVVGDDRRVDITSRNYNCRVYRLGFFLAAVHGSIIGMRGET